MSVVICRTVSIAGLLRRVIDRTRFAISTEETRYYLNSIYVHAADGTAAVATDGHRLARVETDLLTVRGYARRYHAAQDRA